MERLWAPWRMAYIMTTVKQNDDGCVFCQMLAEQDDERNLILRRLPHAFVVMNLFPYNTGHLMVVPTRHTGDFSSLSDDEHQSLVNLLKKSQVTLERCLSPHGFNLGMNLGRASGAGITDHLHYHIVPRWTGDSNFMPVLSDTKVISESLADTYRRLKEEFYSSR
ncbi:HIT domain-containing protein [bacterium]|nr:HIT domain-containing protein [bacterium]MBU1984030.1 HIT domain-containing protein [bacterium]